MRGLLRVSGRVNDMTSPIKQMMHIRTIELYPFFSSYKIDRKQNKIEADEKAEPMPTPIPLIRVGYI